MRNDIIKANALTLEEMNDIAKAGKDLGEAIAMDSEDFDKVFAEIKIAADGVKSVFSKLKDKMDHNDFEEVSKKAEHLGKLLENNEIIGRQIKTAGNVAIDLAKDIVSLGGAILAGHFGAVPTAASNIAIDLVYTGKLLVQATHSFKTFYKTKLKPKFIKITEKIDKQEEKIKGDLKQIGQAMDNKLEETGHWFEKKLNIKNSNNKKAIESTEEKEMLPLYDSDILVSAGVEIE